MLEKLMAKWRAGTVDDKRRAEWFESRLALAAELLPAVKDYMGPDVTDSEVRILATIAAFTSPK